MKAMTTTEYAEARGVTVQAVNSAISHGHRLPGVLMHSKSGRYWILTVDEKKITKKVKK